MQLDRPKCAAILNPMLHTTTTRGKKKCDCLTHQTATHAKPTGPKLAYRHRKRRRHAIGQRLAHAHLPGGGDGTLRGPVSGMEVPVFLPDKSGREGAEEGGSERGGVECRALGTPVVPSSKSGRSREGREQAKGQSVYNKGRIVNRQLETRRTCHLNGRLTS